MAIVWDDEQPAPAETAPDITAHVDALIQHESGGNPAAIGDAGLALGLGQMHPEVRKAYGVTSNSTPDEQRAAVTNYFTDLYKKHNGNADDALSEYHLGAPNYAKDRNSPDNLKYLEEHKKHLGVAPTANKIVWDTDVPQSTEQPDYGNDPRFNTQLSPDEEAQFQQWKAQYAPKDSGYDYDLRGAFKAGLKPDAATGHWDDAFKKPNHPTFSTFSQYAKLAPEKAGTWEGNTYIPPQPPSTTTTVTSTPEQAAAQKAGEPIPQPPAKPLRDLSIEEAGDEINKTYGMPPGHWTGRYTAALGKPAVDALSDLYDAIINGGDLSQPEGVETMLKALPALIPATIPAMAVGNVAETAAKDGGANPTIAKAIGFATSLLAGAKMTPGGEFRASTGEMPLKGTSTARQAVSEAVETAAATPETAAAAETAQTAAKAASESPEVAAAAKKVLAPSAVPVEEAGTKGTTALEQRLQEWKEPTQGIYDEYVKRHAADLLNPDREGELIEQMTALREAGKVRGEVTKPLEAVEAKLLGGEHITVEEASNYKKALDEILPGVPTKGATPGERALYDFKYKIRDLMREGATGEEKEWLNAADNVYRDIIIGRGKPRALGSIVRLVKKDPETAVQRLFGTGTSDSQGLMAKAVLKELGDHPAAEDLRSAFMRKMLKPAADEAVSRDAIINRYDGLNETFRDAISTPGAKTFFDVLKKTRAADKPNMLANFTAKGLEVAAGEALAAMLGHPGYGIIGAGRFLLPADPLARALANSKTANLLARALKTPANSAVVPVLMQKIKSLSEEKPSKKAA